MIVSSFFPYYLYFVSFIVHGWFYGDRHATNRDADIGDYENFIEHIKESENDTHKVLVFDSGDFTQVFFLFCVVPLKGTGLSDTTHPPGIYIMQLASMVNISALTLGNHELYNDATIDYIAANHTAVFGDRFKSSFLFYFDFIAIL